MNYLKPTMLYIMAEKRLSQLESIKKELEKLIDSSPHGKICVRRKKNYLEYYLRKSPDEKIGTYIRKSDRKTIQTYLQKDYNEKLLKQINFEISNLESFLSQNNPSQNNPSQNNSSQNNPSQNNISNVNNYNQSIQQIYSSYPEEAKSYITPLDCSDEDYINMWLDHEYEGNPIEDNKLFKTDKGEYVRSKSELNIANALFKHNIPYKYELPLTLKHHNTIYPDFTVLNVRLRKEFYWEHRGMMDDREYAKKNVQRNKEYLGNGIFLGDRLIITEETQQSPLGTEEIENIIRHYFQ